MSETLTQGALEHLKTIIRSYYVDADLSLIERAYQFAQKAHEKQQRSSGDPYIIHPIEVATILAEMRLDLASIIAGLLHDTVEDTSTSLETISAEFGTDVRDLVDGVTKLSKITFRTSEEKQAENFRKMIMAMAKDIRVILVKLADRLNNMRTLEHLASEKRQRISQETLDIYAPIANRLGISWVKLELEDLCLKHLHPDAYAKLTEKIIFKRNEREAFIDGFIELIRERLNEYDIKAQVFGRAKHFYSIYKKMERRQADFDQIQDLIAFRIIVENITECYKALGVIHSSFKPIPGRFKDYIAMPKANNYQSLHTTVIGAEGDRIEIQIRTDEMNLIAERGIAAHWKYKEGRFDSNSTDKVQWVSRLLEWHKDLSDPNEFLETVKIDLFAEDVFVFTPGGEVKELPFGATPIDFAYAVHTNVGNRCVGAKVNGKIVPLKHRLKSGDTIEILTSTTQTPSKDWLTIAKTSRAKAKIRSFIKLQEREESIRVGKELCERFLRPYGKNPRSLEKSGELLTIAQKLQCKVLDELFVALGYLKISETKFLEAAIPNYTPPEKSALEPSKRAPVARAGQDSRNAILVADLGDIMIRYGRCCNPLPGDSIMGFVTRGRGVTVHTTTCQKGLDQDQERRVQVEWNKALLNQGIQRQVRIRVLCQDTPGLLATMSQAITSSGSNIASANIRTTQDKKAIAIFNVEVRDIPQLLKVISSLESKNGVIHVERVRN